MTILISIYKERKVNLFTRVFILRYNAGAMIK